MKKQLFLLLIILAILPSCGEYQKLLKTNDPELKFTKGIEYFNAGQYTKAQTLFDDVSGYYRGTERSEQVLIYLARCYMGEKDYASAAEYYQSYVKNYPKGESNIEARFMVAHAYYMDSPDARLDQEQTNMAIEYYQQFVEMFPDNPYTQQAYDEMGELYNKLAYKEFLSAQLYYNLGSYLGNNYLACETVARNALKKYPSSDYNEEFYWLILQAKYQQAINSVESLKAERVRDAIDEYYNYITEFPDSKHSKKAEEIGKTLKKLVKE